MEIVGVDPVSGSAGTLVTITGIGFGATQGSGSVSIGGTPMYVVSWSDSAIVAAVAGGTTTDLLTVQQGSLTATGPIFTVNEAGGNPSSVTYQVSPASLSLLVGQSRTVSVTDNGQVVTHLGWTTSDSTIVSLSADDPPLITGVAPGTATVYAGAVAIPVTVYAGTSLPSGTPIWTLPLPGAGGTSGSVSLIPAVPSDSGVDMFALTPGALSAITSDGNVAWTIGVPAAATVISDFSGNALLQVPNSPPTSAQQAVSYNLQRIDPITQQTTTLYTSTNLVTSATPGNGETTVNGFFTVIPHPSGVLFVQDNTTIYVIDPTTGNQLANVTADESTSVNTEFGSPPQTSTFPTSAFGKMIVAGDGNAYMYYNYGTYTWTQTGSDYEDTTSTTSMHFMLLRVSPDGTSGKTDLGDSATSVVCTQVPIAAKVVFYSYQCASTFAQEAAGDVSLITNADSGVAVFNARIPGGCANAYLADYIDLGGNEHKIDQQSGCLDSSNIHVQISYVSQDSLAAQINDAVLLPVSDTLSAGVNFPSLTPILQREDGSYIAINSSNGEANGDPGRLGSEIFAIAPSGGVLWTQPITSPASISMPLYATDGGGVIVSGGGNLYTLDQDGDVVSQSADTNAVPSWLGNWYASSNGAVSEVAPLPVDWAASFAGMVGGNLSNVRGNLGSAYIGVAEAVEGRAVFALPQVGTNCKLSTDADAKPVDLGGKARETYEKLKKDLLNKGYLTCKKCGHFFSANSKVANGALRAPYFSRLTGAVISQTPFDGLLTNISIYNAGTFPKSWLNDTVKMKIFKEAPVCGLFVPYQWEGKYIAPALSPTPLVAISQGEGTAIYINSDLAANNLNEGTIVHEALHNLTGLADHEPKPVIGPQMLDLKQFVGLDSPNGVDETYDITKQLLHRKCARKP
jgi:hypothetical protein